MLQFCIPGGLILYWFDPVLGIPGVWPFLDSIVNLPHGNLGTSVKSGTLTSRVNWQEDVISWFIDPSNYSILKLYKYYKPQ